MTSTASGQQARPIDARVRTHGAIFRFWAPLAAQWFMMASESPFLAAVIARMAEPMYNLAAYGVAYALAILVESPVIMLMSASTALVEDARSYRRLRAFAMMLNAGATAMLLLMLIPAVYDGLMSSLLGLPEEVSSRVYGALWILLPWPAAIGYRRFLHGVLIRSGRTRLVAYGTAVRLTAMFVTALAMFAWGRVPGAWVGAAALSVGVCVEAIAARFMAAAAVRELLHGEEPIRAPLAPAPRVRGFGWIGRISLRGYSDISRFYFPLALTSLIALTVHPMLTFFMGRAPFPVESLAVFPVVHALAFFFRTPAFSFQEAAIALVGKRLEHARKLGAFAGILALGSSVALALVAFTPAATFWFETVSGLPPELAAYAYLPIAILVPLPAVAIFLSFQQALLVQGRRTRAITAASAIEVVTIAVVFMIFGWSFGLVGVSAAMIAVLGGRIVATSFLSVSTRRVIRESRGTSLANDQGTLSVS
jgi:progressive ankylosis protein